jgi:hypothetical protein
MKIIAAFVLAVSISACGATAGPSAGAKTGAIHDVELADLKATWDEMVGKRVRVRATYKEWGSTEVSDVEFAFVTLTSGENSVVCELGDRRLAHDTFFDSLEAGTSQLVATGTVSKHGIVSEHGSLTDCRVDKAK